MLHQILFFTLFVGLFPAILMWPFVGAMVYAWLDYLPPYEVYAMDFMSSNLAFATGALTFLAWLVREKKTLPRPLGIMILMAVLLIWVNVTSYFALVPQAAAFEWNRTVKVIGFAMLTAQMLSTRARLEAFVWAFVLAVAYFAVPSAIKLVVSGGGGGVGTGEVIGGAAASFFGDRVTLSVVLAMAVPFALYLGPRATLLPARWLPRARPVMLGLIACLLLAMVGTFARTAVFAGGATMLMIAVRSRRKLLGSLAVVAAVVALFTIAPAHWFSRMDTIVDYQQDGSAMDRIAAWKWAWQMALSHPIVGGGFGVFVLDAGSIPGRPGWLAAHNIFFQMMAEHGFVGLGLFCGLMLAVWSTCSTVQKRVLGQEEYAWCGDLAWSTQIALVAFAAGGSFVSIATNPYLFTLAGIALGTRSIVEREIKSARQQRRQFASSPVAAAPA